MKKILLSLVVIIIVLAAILLIKTWSYPFKINSKSQEFTNIDTTPSDLAIQHLAGGIRIPTVSNIIYEDTNFKPFDEFKIYLQKEYPLIYQTMDTLTINSHSLLYHWKGKNPNAKPILLLSHYDVVPVVGYDVNNILDTAIVFRPNDKPSNLPDTLYSKWDFPPFSGAVANGNIYGRGSLDMKGMLFSILEGANTLIEEGFQPEQDIWIAFGHDEEVSGRQGAVKIADYFKQQGLEFDAVYDEGGIIASPKSAIPSVNKPIALIGTGEKGFLTTQITVKGIGGHSSMPPLKSSLVYAAEIIEKLNNDQMPAEIIPPIQAFLDNIGGEMGFSSKLAIANQWILKSVLLKTLAKSPASNALIRTTTAISMAKGSDAPNVLSSQAEITVNFRLLPGNTVQQVIEHIDRICKGYDVEIKTISSREASSISPSNTRGFQVMQKLINQLYPDAIVTPYITIGGTDAYKYQIVSNHIYRLMPILLNTYEQRSMHNENEHISIANYGRMIWYFKQLMATYQATNEVK